MTYSNSAKEKFTLIDDLIDLDDPSPSNNNILPPGQQDKMKRIIRQPHQTKYNEQMNLPNGPQYQMPQPYQTPQPYQIPQPYQMPQQYQMPQPYQSEYNIPLHAPYSCLDIASHIDNCPICSKFYKNDKSIYIVTIVILVIICIILLKKALEK